MSSEEYWNRDPYLAESYREAYELKLRMKNQDAWWQGFYIHEAVAAAVASIAGNNFHYPKTPHDLTPQNKEEAAKQEREKAKAQLNLRMFALKEKYGRKQN